MHKIIFVSNLYPNAREPNRGLYNFHLMQALQSLGHEVEVIAPVSAFSSRRSACPAKLAERRREVGGQETEDRDNSPQRAKPSSFVSWCLRGSKQQSPTAPSSIHPTYLYTPGIFIHHHWRMYRHAIAPILRARIQKSEVKGQLVHHLVHSSFSEGGRSETGSRISDPANPTEPISSFCPNLSVSKDHRPSSLGSPTSDLRPPTSDLHIILGFIYPDAVAMDAICRELGVPYSVLVLGSDFRIRMQQPRFRPLVMRCLQQAPHILCPGQALKNDMVQCGIPADKITSFHNGVDPAVFTTDQTPRQNELLFVGNLVAVKAPERVLRAFQQLQDLRSGGLRLVMIGEGSIRKRLEKLAARVGIAPDEIEWTGSLPQAAVAQRMRRARLLCLCSRSEGMPNVVAEALACGCPVVATSVGEIPYMLNESNGIIVPQHDDESATIQALTAALAQALAITYDHARIANATTHYRWSAAAHRVEQGLGISD